RDHASAKMLADRSDVRFEGGAEFSGGQRREPSRNRAVPDERMPLDLHAVAQTERDDGIPRAEVLASTRALDGVPLHLELGGEVVEMTPEHAGVSAVAEQAGFDRGADELPRRPRRVAHGL